MVTEWLEAAKILNNGKVDVMRAVVFGLPILLFTVWRLSALGGL